MALIGLNGLELELGRTNNHLIDCRLSNLIATVGFEKMFTYYALYTYVLQILQRQASEKKLFTLYHEERHFSSAGSKIWLLFSQYTTLLLISLLLLIYYYYVLPNDKTQNYDHNYYQLPTTYNLFRVFCAKKIISIYMQNRHIKLSLYTL